MKKNLIFALMLMVAFAGFVAGCGDKKKAEEEESSDAKETQCETDADCARWQYCTSAGFCAEQISTTDGDTDGDISDGDEPTDGDTDGDDITDGDETCRSNRDCAEGKYCYMGTCVVYEPECEEASDCGEPEQEGQEYVCIHEECVTQWQEGRCGEHTDCFLTEQCDRRENICEEANACGSYEDCLHGFYCGDEGACLQYAPCTDETGEEIPESCLNSQYCDLHTGRCAGKQSCTYDHECLTPPEGMELGTCYEARCGEGNLCEFKSLCADNEVCEEGECLATCQDDFDCRNGYWCDQGVCLEGERPQEDGDDEDGDMDGDTDGDTDGDDEDGDMDGDTDGDTDGDDEDDDTDGDDEDGDTDGDEQDVYESGAGELTICAVWSHCGPHSCNNVSVRYISDNGEQEVRLALDGDGCVSLSLDLSRVIQKRIWFDALYDQENWSDPQAVQLQEVMFVHEECPLSVDVENINHVHGLGFVATFEETTCQQVVDQEDGDISDGDEQEDDEDGDDSDGDDGASEEEQPVADNFPLSGNIGVVMRDIPDGLPEGMLRGVISHFNQDGDAVMYDGIPIMEDGKSFQIPLNLEDVSGGVVYVEVHFSSHFNFQRTGFHVQEVFYRKDNGDRVNAEEIVDDPRVDRGIWVKLPTP